MKIYKKIIFMIGFAVLIIFSIRVFPTLCNIIFSKVEENEFNVWDGTVAEVFESGAGTIDNPYIISTPQQFMLIFNENYNSGKYFKIVNDLFFNTGSFDIENDNYNFIKNNVKYNLLYNSDGLYDDLNNRVDALNLISDSFDFNGVIDGDNHTLYGLFISFDDASLFNSYSGEIKNLKIANSFIWGSQSSSIINNSNNTNINDFIFNGTIISNEDILSNTQDIEDISYVKGTATVNLYENNFFDSYSYYNITLQGNASGKININGTRYSNNFTININDVNDLKTIELTSTNEGTISNISINYNYRRSISGLIKESNNTTISKSILKGLIYSNHIGSSFIGVSHSNNNIFNSYNVGTINSSNVASGIIGYNSGEIEIVNTYNAGNIISSNISSGFIGKLGDSSVVTLNNTFNLGSISGTNLSASYVGINNSNNITSQNNYYFNSSNNSIGSGNVLNIASYIDKDSYLSESNLIYNNYIEENGWTIQNDNVPVLNIDDITIPNIEIKYIDMSWNNIHDRIERFILLKNKFEIISNDIDSEILKEEYFLDNSCTPSNSNYTNFDYSLGDNIQINDNGCYTLYVKTTDTMGNIAYANTDTLIFNEINSEISYDNNIYKENDLLYKDVLVDYKFENNLYNISNGKIYIESNKRLDSGIKIALQSRDDNQIYYYVVDDNDIKVLNNKYYYSLSLFKNMNQINYNNIVTSNINLGINLNFNFMNIQSDKDFLINLVILEDDNIISKSNQLNDIYIFSDSKNGYSIECDNCQNIDIRELNNYDFNIVLNRKNNIYDGSSLDDYQFISYITYEDNVVNDENIINNFVFNLNNDYYINNSGYSRMNVTDENFSLKVNIINNYNIIRTGQYYLNLKLINKYYKDVSSNVITIPITSKVDIYSGNCNFEIVVPNLSHYIEKKELMTKVGNKVRVHLKYNGDLINPYVKMSFYKYLSNGNYEKVDICNYIDCTNYTVSDNEITIYNNLVSNQNYEHQLELIYNNFDYGEYKLVYTLYDFDNIISFRESKFIVW